MSLLRKVTSNATDATFDRIIQETASQSSITSSSNKSNRQRSLLDSVTSQSNDYTSPFRANNLSQEAKKQLQLTKTSKFPTTSATSSYNKRSYKDQGFVDIHKKKPKDINFPVYLIENEQRQEILLKDLDEKESKLRRFQESQIIDDLTSRKKDDPMPEVLEPDESESCEPEEKIDTTNRIDAEYEYPRPAPEEPEQNEDDLHIGPPDYDIGQEGVNDLLIVSNHLNDANDMVLQKEIRLEKPLTDTTKIPHVPFKIGDKLVTENTLLATPENPERIVKIDKYGHVSKYVHDKIQYDKKVQANAINQINVDHKKHMIDTKADYEARFAAINKEKLEILEKINQLNLDKINQLDVIQNKLIRDLFSSNSAFADDKNLVLKNTELIKEQKLKELEFFKEKKTLLQGEINEINLERDTFANDYNTSANNLSDISQRLDAKLFKLSQVNNKQSNLSNDIEELQLNKANLEKEIEANNQTKATNVDEVEKLKAGTHEKNVQLEKMNKDIQTKLAALAIVKEEVSNEHLSLAKLTNEIELEKKRNQELMEETQRNYENKLKEKDSELNTKLGALTNTHDEELKNLRAKFDQELKDAQEKAAKEEAARLKAEAEAESQLKAKKLAESHAKKEAEARAKAEKKYQAQAATNPRQNNSLYSFETEEEVIYQ